MGPIVILAFLIQSHQLLTHLAYVSAATVNCNENSVIVEDKTFRYSGVNLLVENSVCQKYIQQETESAMKSLCTGLNIIQANTERQNALNTRLDNLERKVELLVQTIINIIGRCPVGYDYYEQDSFCYKFNSACKTWSEARQACLQENADLISLSVGNFNFFRTLAISKAGACNAVWVGSTDAALEGRWNWLNGDRVASSLWQPGQPDNWANKEHCANIAKLTDYRMNDEDCNFKAHFVCQIA